MRTAPPAPAAIVAAAIVATASSVFAAPATADPALTAKLATEKAKDITLRDLHGSVGPGSVRLVRIGRTRTRVIVRIPQGGDYAMTLHPGTDCNDNVEIARSAIALAPLNAAAANAPESRTIVELPIETLRSKNYVVDVRKATEQRAVVQACARLTR